MNIASLFLKQKLRERIVKCWRAGYGAEHFSAHITLDNLPKLYFENGIFEASSNSHSVLEWIQSRLDEKEKNVAGFVKF